jgi:2-desacetyl-2-hydroxyethyl bacteriochlorophyllide A dehydrogenase
VDGITPWSPEMPPPYPLVPGYQRVGIVESAGRDVQGIHEGQWVFATYSKIQRVHLGFGGHIARGPVDAAQLYPLPIDAAEPIDFSGSVLAQVGYNSGARPPVAEGDAALVVGDGLVGHWAAQTLQVRGARVALAGRHDFRLGLFETKEGDITINARDQAWIEKARAWSGGEFDIVVDTVGNQVNYETNMKLVPLIRKGGHFVATGHEGDKAFVDLREFIRREATIHCPMGWQRPRLETTIAWIHEGKLKTRHLITHRLPARRAAEAWRRIFDERRSTLGVVLEWDE